MAVCVTTAPQRLTARDLGPVAFFLLTSAIVAAVGQYLRERAAWQQFESRSALQAEQAHSHELLTQLERLSLEDPLTGVANRRSWDASIDREIDRARRLGSPLTVLLCDLDGLKLINDALGHLAGDCAIQETATALRTNARAVDVVARIGGDEFAVLCTDTDADAAESFAARLRIAVGALEVPELQDARLTVSIGIAGLVGKHETGRELVARADATLYDVKRRRDVTRVGGKPT